MPGQELTRAGRTRALRLHVHRGASTISPPRYVCDIIHTTAAWLPFSASSVVRSDPRPPPLWALFDFLEWAVLDISGTASTLERVGLRRPVLPIARVRRGPVGGGASTLGSRREIHDPLQRGSQLVVGVRLVHPLQVERGRGHGVRLAAHPQKGLGRAPKRNAGHQHPHVACCGGGAGDRGVRRGIRDRLSVLSVGAASVASF